MPDPKIKQLQCQSESWKRILGFMREENAYMKDCVSELAKNEVHIDLLDKLEIFQNRFVKADELISLLRDEVNELENLLNRDIFENGNMMKMADKRFRKVKANIETTQQDFAKLLQDFNNYVLETLEVKTKGE